MQGIWGNGVCLGIQKRTIVDALYDCSQKKNTPVCMFFLPAVLELLRSGVLKYSAAKRHRIGMMFGSQ